MDHTSTLSEDLYSRRPLRGHANSYTSPSRGDHRQNPWGGRYFIGCAGHVQGEFGRPIIDAGRTTAIVVKGSNMGKGPRHTTVGVTGKFDKNGVPIGAPLSGYDLENDGSTFKKKGGGI